MSLNQRWQKIRERLKGYKETPERIARAAALGALLGSSATFGLAIFLVYPLARLLRLNWVITLSAKLFVSNPWTTPFIWLAQLWLGFLVMVKPFPAEWRGLLRDMAVHPTIHWTSMALFGDLGHYMTELYKLLGPLFWIYVAGATVFGILSALLTYGLVYLGARAALRNGATEE